MRLAATLVFFCALSSVLGEDVRGRWEGSIQIPGREFNLIVDLDRAAGGESWIGSIIIPGLGVKGSQLSDLVVKGSDVSFAIKGALASERVGQTKLKAQLNGAGELTGDFLQAGNSAPFTLRKTGPPQVELPRKSTGLGKDFAGEWKGDFELNGYPRHVTLTLVEHGPNPATAQMVIVGKRTTNAPIDLVIQENNFLTVQSQEIGITYEGRLRKETGEIAGSVMLGSLELPLVVKRTAATP
jgi:hypothetical protein